MNLVIPKYNLKHTRPILGYGNFGYTHHGRKDCMVDTEIVENKYRLWRDVVKNNLLNSPDSIVRARAYSLLKDKTILAYSQLKYDNLPVKMMWMQDAILSDDSDRVLFCGCNQHIGKSFTLNIDAATEFMIDHGHGWVGLLVSGSLPQSQYQMDRIKMLLKSSNIDYREEETEETKTGKKDNATQISYSFYDTNGSPKYRNLLVCCPHTSSALGYPANNIWLDEFDFWENCDQNSFMYQVIIPRTFQTKGKIKIYSNPNGREKMMYELWNQQDKNNNFVWHRYHFNYWDKPFSSQQEFDKLVVGMERSRVESTMLAIFSRTEGAFFSSDEVNAMLDSDLCEKGDSSGYGKQTAWFLDIGTVHDQCCLIGAYITENKEVPEIPIINLFWIHKYPVGFPLARVIGVESSIDMNDGWESYTSDNPSIKSILDQYSEEINGKKIQPLFGFDATGNAGLIPLFQSIDIEGVDIVFSGPKKWHMYQRYQYYVQKRFIKRAHERDNNTITRAGVPSNFNNQALRLVVKKTTSNSYRKIHHENEDDLDDTQDSVAGVIHLIENPDVSSLSFDIINKDYQFSKSLNGVDSLIEDKLKDQYIPSFYRRDELVSWIDKKERDYH